MTNSQQLLAKLHDIHLPPPMSWWPLAPGWYFLLSGILLLMVYLLYMLRRSYRNSRAKRQALHLLIKYRQEYKHKRNSQISSMKVSELLRRVALVYFSREEIAGLQGEAWLVFLNTTFKGHSFNPVRHCLLELPYQPANETNIDELFDYAKQWIKQRRRPCSN